MGRTNSQDAIWNDLFNEFKRTYPNFRDRAIGFNPADDTSIIVFLKLNGGTEHVKYDGMIHRAYMC